MKSKFYILFFIFSVLAFAQQLPPRAFEKYDNKGNNEPCVQVYLNTTPMACGNMISKKTKGLITVSKDNINKIYFNITVKSSTGKNEPPVYLRFIKVKQMDIQELLQYTQDGDEIFIEEYVPAVNKIDLNCTPTNFVVHNPS
ncbi:MAG: hypothetical protein IPK18_02705 [Sphingobacteriales bacterium]|nr:MAG: hypothetical protein IPK18_02705 [Sphingobacteriales bacterium]